MTWFIPSHTQQITSGLSDWDPYASLPNAAQQLHQWAIPGLGNADNLGSGYGAIRPTFGALYNDPWNLDAVPHRFLGFPEGPLYENSVPQVNAFQLPAIAGTNLVQAPLISPVQTNQLPPTIATGVAIPTTEYAVTPAGIMPTTALTAGTTATQPYIAPSRSGPGVGGPIFTGLTPTVPPTADTRLNAAISPITQTPIGNIPATAQVTGTAATTPYIVPPRTGPGVAGPLYTSLTPTVPPGYTSVIAMEIESGGNGPKPISSSPSPSSSSTSTSLSGPTMEPTSTSASTPTSEPTGGPISTSPSHTSIILTTRPELQTTLLAHTVSQHPLDIPTIHDPFIAVWEHAQYHPQTQVAATLPTPLVYGTRATVPLITPARSGASVSGRIAGELSRYPLRLLPMSEIMPATGIPPLYELFAPTHNR